jgi:uncharacterized protein (DUF885 family)
METTRRQLLIGLGALALAPATGSAAAATSLRTVFERVASARDQAATLAVLRAVSPDGLDLIDRSLLRMVIRGLEREVALRRAFPFGKADGSSPYVVSQRHGAYLQLREPGDPARRLDEETERLRAEAARGLSPADFIVDAVAEAQLELARNAGAEVRAALQRQVAVLRALRPAATPGVWRLPGGEDYYRLRLRCTSGLEATPAEIERHVAAETTALLRRADRLLKGLGLARGSVGERLRALKRRPQYLYANDDTGRTRAVADMNAALARLRPHLSAWFNPPLELGSAVRRMSVADERAGKRGYRDPPTAAGPGAYYPDLAAVHERPA